MQLVITGNTARPLGAQEMITPSRLPLLASFSYGSPGAPAMEHSGYGADERRHRLINEHRGWVWGTAARCKSGPFYLSTNRVTWSKFPHLPVPVSLPVK